MTKKRKGLGFNLDPYNRDYSLAQFPPHGETRFTYEMCVSLVITHGVFTKYSANAGS